MQARHVVTFDAGEEQTVFMSFGLLNTLVNYLGGPENLHLIRTSPEVRETFLVELLSPRDSHGRIPRGSEFNLYSSNLSVEEGLALLDWVEGHLTDFFVKAAQSLKSQAAAMTAATSQSSSESGSKP